MLGNDKDNLSQARGLFIGVFMVETLKYAIHQLYQNTFIVSDMLVGIPAMNRD